jgi:hypothetical protein
MGKMFPRIPTGGVYREYVVPLQQKILLSLNIVAFFCREPDGKFP